MDSDSDIPIGKVLLWFLATVADIIVMVLLFGFGATLLNKADDFAVIAGVVLLVGAILLFIASVLFVAKKAGGKARQMSESSAQQVQARIIDSTEEDR